MLAGDGRRLVAGTDQVVTSVSAVDDFEALAACRADDDDLFDSGVCAERMSGSDRDIPGDEDSNPHEGWTGVQDSGGSGSLFRPSRAAATPTAAASTRSTERRFTGVSLSLRPGVPALLQMGIEIDHVVICIDDLDAGAGLLWSRYGLNSYPGGRHAGHGTANRIVPLGSSYLELVAIVDSEEASASTFGEWVEAEAGQELKPSALCLPTDDLDLVSARLGLEVTAMSRGRPDGVQLRWRLAGLNRTVDDGLPFFIEWDIRDEHHPGRGTQLPAAASTSVQLRLPGDVGQLSDWVGGAPGVSLSEGSPGVAEVRIRTEDRVIEL